MKKRLLLSVKQNGQYYVDAFENCGAQTEAVYLPKVDTGYDGLVLCGGDDVDPIHYGRENTACGPLDPERDLAELALLDAYVKAGKPVMGICRGQQLMNVYFGGTLHQHIDCVAQHRQSIEHYCVHKVTASGFIKELYGEEFFVNSYHHQAVEQLGTGLIPLAWADGILEAFCHESLPVFSVQWHPEKLCFNMKRDDAVDGAPLLKHFLDMC